MLMQLSNKIRYMVIGALIVPCFGRIALHNTGHEHEYYRFLVPLFIGAVAGYLIGLMKDRWMALNDDLIQTNADLEAKIRAQKETEAALQESEARYRSLFDNNHSAMLLVHPETAAIVDANPAAVAYYGWAREVFRQKRLTEFTPLVRDEIRDIMASAKREEQQRFIAAQTLASGERREVEIFCGPIRVKGEILLSAIVHDVSDRLQIEKEREALIQELQRALKEIKSLQGIIPICSSCKNIRNDAGAWSQLEEYLSEHSDAEFSHGLCPQCAKTLYPDVDL